MLPPEAQVAFVGMSATAGLFYDAAASRTGVLPMFIVGIRRILRRFCFFGISRIGLPRGPDFMHFWIAAISPICLRCLEISRRTEPLAFLSFRYLSVSPGAGCAYPFSHISHSLFCLIRG